LANLRWLRANGARVDVFGTNNNNNDGDGDDANVGVIDEEEEDACLERLVFAEHDVAALGGAWQVADGKRGAVDDGPCCLFVVLLMILLKFYYVV
jgi:hypothetical protein